jgi:putative hemolysin
MGASAKIEKPLITEEELKSFVEIGEESGTIESDEKEMIHNIFKLNDIEVREVMTPKIKMASLHGDMTLGDAMDFLVSSRHSRFPLYLSDKDKISSILHIKDTIEHIRNQNYGIKLKELGKYPLIVPETKLADDLLNEMKKKRRQIAIVVDEYGIVAGLITIEDLLEEIVGEIYDETDIIEANVKRIDKKTARVKGETSIEELNKKFRMSLDITNGYDTISGYILKEIGRIPEQGEEIELPDFYAIVERLEDSRIAAVTITKK